MHTLEAAPCRRRALFLSVPAPLLSVIVGASAVAIIGPRATLRAPFDLGKAYLIRSSFVRATCPNFAL